MKRQKKFDCRSQSAHALFFSKMILWLDPYVYFMYAPINFYFFYFSALKVNFFGPPWLVLYLSKYCFNKALTPLDISSIQLTHAPVTCMFGAQAIIEYLPMPFLAFLLSTIVFSCYFILVKFLKDPQKWEPFSFRWFEFSWVDFT